MSADQSSGERGSQDRGSDATDRNRPAGPSGAPDRAEFDDRLKRLERELDARMPAKAAQAGGPARQGGGFAEALKVGSEFVAGVLVGAAIGYGIDWVAGTRPFGLILFLMLGFAAGVLNVLRSQGAIAQPTERLRKRGSDPGGGPGAGGSAKG